MTIALVRPAQTRFAKKLEWKGYISTPVSPSKQELINVWCSQEQPDVFI